MVITAIKAQVKNSERISVFIDGKYVFSLTYNQLLEQKLHVGLEIDRPRLEELKHTCDFGKAYERALLYVMLRPRSYKEVRDYARRKNWSTEDTQKIIDKLTQHKYLDDANFARAWVESRILNKNISQRKLCVELKQKGVAENIISDVLKKAQYDENDALKTLINKKQKLTRYADDQQKLTRYLIGQGFNYEDIKSALNH